MATRHFSCPWGNNSINHDLIGCIQVLFPHPCFILLLLLMPRPSTPLLHPSQTTTSQHAVSGGGEKRTGDPSQAQRQSHLAGDLVFLVLGLGLGLLEEEDGDKDVDDDDAEQNPVVVLARVLFVKDRAGNDLRVD
jgi:hypothetical protein